MVGKRHHGKTNTSQGAVGRFRAISERISSMRGGGRSSLNDQQSLNPQEPPKNNLEHALGTLSSGGTASQSDIHARRLSDLCQQLDSSSMGESPLRRDQDYRSGTLATSDGSDGRDQSQAKVRHVGRVLTRRTLGVLRPQSNFFRHTGWNRGKEGSEHWCTRQCEATESSARVVTRRGQAGAGTIGVSRPASCVCRRCLRNTSRRAWGTALVRLRLQQHELQCPTFVLLATRRTPRQSACDQQVSSGDDNEQTAGTGKAGGCDSARRCTVGKQVNSGPLISQRPLVQPNSADKGNIMSDRSKVLIGPKRTQIVFGGSL